MPLSVSNGNILHLVAGGGQRVVMDSNPRPNESLVLEPCLLYTGNECEIFGCHVSVTFSANYMNCRTANVSELSNRLTGGPQHAFFLV